MRLPRLRRKKSSKRSDGPRSRTNPCRFSLNDCIVTLASYSLGRPLDHSTFDVRHGQSPSRTFHFPTFYCSNFQFQICLPSPNSLSAFDSPALDSRPSTLDSGLILHVPAFRFDDPSLLGIRYGNLTRLPQMPGSDF